MASLGVLNWRTWLIICAAWLRFVKGSSEKKTSTYLPEVDGGIFSETGATGDVGKEGVGGTEVGWKCFCPGGW